MTTVVAEGTTLATGSEQTLATSALLATFQFNIRLNNLAGVDSITVRLKSKIGSGGTLRTVYSEVFTGPQAEPNLVMVGPPMPSAWDYEVSIQQTAGTNRNYDWRLDAIGACTVAGSGSATIATNVETNLISTATPGTYVLAVDLGGMTGIDNLTLRLRMPTLSGGTAEVLFSYTPTAGGAQSTPNILMLSLPASCPYGMVGSLQPNHVNSRVYPWALYEVAAAA